MSNKTAPFLSTFLKQVEVAEQDAWFVSRKNNFQARNKRQKQARKCRKDQFKGKNCKSDPSNKL